MKSIDFLPDIYRQREGLRRARLWWAIVVVLFGGAIGASTMAQVWLRHGLNQQLDELLPQYATAQSQVHELSRLQMQIVRAANEASLYTFLDSPWPRTQLLAEVVRPLPESIQLTQIHIAEEELARNSTAAGPRRTKAEEEAAAKATPPERDLAKLHDEMERRQTTIEVDGHTADVPRLHEFVDSVNRSPLIAEAHIKSLEAATANHQGRTRFTLRLIVRPAYCQSGSDAKPPPAAAATTAARERLAPGGGR